MRARPRTLSSLTSSSYTTGGRLSFRAMTTMEDFGRTRWQGKKARLGLVFRSKAWKKLGWKGQKRLSVKIWAKLGGRWLGWCPFGGLEEPIKRAVGEKRTTRGRGGE